MSVLTKEHQDILRRHLKATGHQVLRDFFDTIDARDAEIAAALADREAEIHHGYQCGETYARLVSAQVDSIVAEKVREAEEWWYAHHTCPFPGLSPSVESFCVSCQRIANFRAAAASSEAKEGKC